MFDFNSAPQFKASITAWTPSALIQLQSRPQICILSTCIEVSSDQEVEDFIAESAIMLDFHHPNVLSLVGVCFDTEDQLPIILLPFMANGDLRAYLKSQRRLRASSKDFPEVCICMVLLFLVLVT